MAAGLGRELAQLAHPALQQAGAKVDSNAYILHQGGVLPINISFPVWF